MAIASRIHFAQIHSFLVLGWDFGQDFSHIQVKYITKALIFQGFCQKLNGYSTVLGGACYIRLTMGTGNQINI